MRRRLVIAALGIWIAAPNSGAAADKLVLLAEDTPGMTRIEINVGEISFSLESPGPGVIDFVTPYRFQTINVAQLISGGLARRVANARVVPDEEATRLRMVLNCDCGFDFSVSSGVLSVRIKDPVKAAVGDLKADEKPKQVATSASKRSPSVGPAPDTAPVPLARPEEKPNANSASVASLPNETHGVDNPIKPIPKPASIEAATDQGPSDEVVLARDHLMRQLSRAADQGLIQFVSDEAAAQSPVLENVAATDTIADPVDPEPIEEVTVAADEPVQDIAEAVAAAPPPSVEIPLRARTAVDKDFSSDRSETRAAVAFCIEPTRLHLVAWAQEGSFLEVSQNLRASLLDEFDQPLPDIATKYARHLVLNGFGAEANEFLKVYGDVVQDRDVLQDLAMLVDLKAASTDGAIARTAPCHPEAALWRLIAGLPDGEAVARSDEGIEREEAEYQRLLDAFAKLPAITRRTLSARLMENLIAKGEFGLANQLDLILLRSPAAYDEALALARARLLSETGRLDEAEDLYSQLSQSNRPEAHTALILLLDSRINRNAGGSQQLSDALGDAAFSARGTASELPLKVAEIRSRVLTDGASGALQTFKAAVERSGDGSALLEDVGHALLEKLEPVNGDVVDYAKAVMTLRPQISEGPTGDPARRHVASVLTGAGLPNLAVAYLEPALERSAQATSIVAARTFLALDKAEEALEVLEGQTDRSTIPLKVEALERLGRFEDAHLMSEETPLDEEVVRAARALRAGAWADASTAGASPGRLLAAFMASKKTLDSAEDQSELETQFLTTPEVDQKTTLDSVKAVVEASKSARSIIERALEDG